MFLNQVLLRKISGSGWLQKGFQGPECGEGPAGTAVALVLDGCKFVSGPEVVERQQAFDLYRLFQSRFRLKNRRIEGAGDQAQRMAVLGVAPQGSPTFLSYMYLMNSGFIGAC